MKICYLADLRSILIQRELKYLLNKGFEVYVISYDELPEENIVAGPNFHFISLNNDVGKAPALRREGESFLKKVFSFFYRIIPAEIDYLITLRLYAARARRFIEVINPDIVHGYYLTTYGYIAARTGKRPLMITAMGDDVLIRPHDSKAMQKIMLYAAKKADCIRTTADYVARQLVKYGIAGEKIRAFPRGVNLSVFKPARNSHIREKLRWQDKKIVIMPRNFHPTCGHEYFIRALPLVLKALPDVRIILAGAGKLETKYRKLISELRLDQFVHFAGYVNEAAMSEYLNSADVYVASSLSDGTSNSLLEAMACGLPVIVSDAPANFEWVEENKGGYLTPRRDPSTLAERLVTLLRDQAMRERMGNYNYKVAQERVNKKFYSAKLEKVYYELCVV